jgi:prephenate dehydrogenase
VSLVSVVGLGLMGGSLVRDLSRQGSEVACWSPEPAETAAAGQLPGVVAADSPDALASDCDGVVFATPLGAVRDLVARWADLTRGSAAWIQDVASLQAPPLDWARVAGLADRYVSAHPMTGSEASGFGASREGLYQGVPVFLSHAGASEPARSGAESFWVGVGATPEWVDAEEHDDRMGWVSHLPQVVSTHLALALEDAGLSPADLGPGGRDMVRLAASSPAMWRDILGHAPGPVSRALKALAERLLTEADRLEAGDAEALIRALERAGRWRKS